MRTVETPRNEEKSLYELDHFRFKTVNSLTTQGNPCTRVFPIMSVITFSSAKFCYPSCSVSHLKGLADARCYNYVKYAFFLQKRKSPQTNDFQILRGCLFCVRTFCLWWHSEPVSNPGCIPHIHPSLERTRTPRRC